MFAACLAGERSSALFQTAAETVDQPRQPLFSTNFASDSLLRTFQVNQKIPDRKTWNLTQAQDRLGETAVGFGSKCSFSLKPVEHRDWRLAKSDAKKRAKGVDPLVPEGPPISEARAYTIGDSASTPNLAVYSEEVKDPNRLTRADRYYQALLKAEKARSELVKREAWEEFLAKAGKAAEKAKKEAQKAERRLEQGNKPGAVSDSESDEDVELDEEEEDPGPLQPYPGVMKVEVEVIVMRAPGADKSDTESSVGESVETADTVSEKSVEDEDAIDWAKELQELQEEYGDKEEEAESEHDSLPDGLGGQKIGNANDAYDKRTALGLGGTAFFVPEVERYAFAPSLLPPPPRGEGHKWLTGNKRLKLKPRLPLEVSKHRWRDEHPYGCPVELDFSPDIDDIRELEEKVRRVELYGTLNSLITSMPKPDGIRTLPETDDFERTLDAELQNSVAWQQYIKRQRLIEIARAEQNGDGDNAERVDPRVLAVKRIGSPKPVRLAPTKVPPLMLQGTPNYTVGTMMKRPRKKKKKIEVEPEITQEDFEPPPVMRARRGSIHS